MADVYEKNLSQKTTLTMSDYIRVVGSDNVSYKQLVSDVANKIITSYSGATLAGSAQSVKSAIDALNTNRNGSAHGTLATGTDLDNVTTPGVYLLNGSSTYYNAPRTYGYLEVLKSSNATGNTIQVQRLTCTDATYFRYSYTSGTQWYNWVTLMPTPTSVNHDSYNTDNVDATSSDTNYAIRQYDRLVIINFQVRLKATAGTNNNHLMYLPSSLRPITTSRGYLSRTSHWNESTYCGVAYSTTDGVYIYSGGSLSTEQGNILNGGITYFTYS